MRLNALELREYVTPRRQTLLLALIRHARGQVLDDLTQMLLRLVRKVEWKSQQRLEQWYADRYTETDRGRTMSLGSNSCGWWSDTHCPSPGSSIAIPDRERTCAMKNRMRQLRTCGTVRGEGHEVLAYS
jgi:hypothetical protein